jgi:hypothetical protein
VIRRLKRDPAVRYAEPDYVMQASAVPNDPQFSLQWGMQNNGQVVNGTGGTSGADERAVPAWDVIAGSSSIVIAETDTGIEYTHPDLASNMWSNPGGLGGCPAGTHGFNVLSGEAPCDPMDQDTAYGGHGTHVAGIIGAVANNGVGVTGVDWTSSIMGVKWLDSNSSGLTSDLISALQLVVQAKQAGQNIRVVNDSVTFVGTAYSQALSDEIDQLGANDILFVTPAGNTGQNNDDPSTPRYPCDYDRPTEICVAATDQNDQMPNWANYGASTVDMGAPGNNIYSTLRNASYGYISGSSMSAAEVSGAAALILSVGYQSVTALKANILNNVDPISALSGRVRTGGRLDICRALPGCMLSMSPQPPAASPPADFTSPVISGTAQSGQKLTVSNGTWMGAPTGYTYQWERCQTGGSSCSAISGATSQSYIVGDQDGGSTLVAAVIAANPAGSTRATSGATRLVPVVAPANSSLPMISGPAEVGLTLTTSNGTWTGSTASYSYQWLRCDTSGNTCGAIYGATSQTYTVAQADFGSTLRTTVSASNSAGSAAATSAATGTVQSATFGKTTVGGSSDSFNANHKRVNRYGLSVSGTVTKLSIYLQPTGRSGQQVLKGIIYADSNGKPSSLLAVSQQLPFLSTNAAGWYDLTFDTRPHLAAGSYYIGVITGGTGNVAGLRYDSVSASRDFNQNSYNSGPSNPFGSFSTDAEQMSLYATYTPG